MKKVIKLSENDLHNIITESVKCVLSELNSKISTVKSQSIDKIVDSMLPVMQSFLDENTYH